MRKSGDSAIKKKQKNFRTQPLAFRVRQEDEAPAVHVREVARVPGATPFGCGRAASQPCVAAVSFPNVCEARRWAKLCKDPIAVGGFGSGGQISCSVQLF